MRRREFLKAAGAVGGAVMLGGAGLLGCDDGGSDDSFETVLDHSVHDCPIDHVVLLMMENRSFDHYLGWLGTDEAYLDAGRRRYGKKFQVDARLDLSYPNPAGELVDVYPLVGAPTEPNPWRGCEHPVPGHGWFAGRHQLNEGFLAPGTGNDILALGYYLAEDLVVHEQLANRFTICDRHFASLLGGTFPNRQYLHSATSDGIKGDPGPLRIGIYPQPTIWDSLTRAGVETAFYYNGFPGLMLFGERMVRYLRPFDAYFEDCASGTLPAFTMLEPKFGGGLRTDDHSRGDVNVGQRFILECFGAFAQSPQWKRGLFILTYDEWGGFFDHVAPPVVPDDRESPIEDDNFGQTGFRVPTYLASPYARRGFVDHRVYDHTSILRFLEWRFLGAPAEGPGGKSWWLTKRDHYANNIGWSLRPDRPDRDPGVDLGMTLPQPSPVCFDFPGRRFRDATGQELPLEVDPFELDPEGRGDRHDALPRADADSVARPSGSVTPRAPGGGGPDRARSRRAGLSRLAGRAPRRAARRSPRSPGRPGRARASRRRPWRTPPASSPPARGRRRSRRARS